MRADRNGSTKKERRLRTRVLGVCLLAGLFAVAMAARPGLRVSLAQSALTQAETQQEQTNPDQAAPDQTAPAPANPDGSNQAPSNPDSDHRAGTAQSQPQALEFDQPVKPAEPQPEVKATFSDPKQQQIADDTAALLKLANSLKADVDKTTPDTLSVAVIRHADQIEKLAHKMRTK